MASTSRFSVPSSLPELEREPYHLLPYPENFHDADEVARGESFLELVRLIEQGNHALAGASMQLFVAEDEDEAEEPWLTRDRMQAFYTLVRKCTSLSPPTRADLAACLCKSVTYLSAIIETSSEPAPQDFRDTFAFHLYMLYSFLFLTEQDHDATTQPNVVPEHRNVALDAMLVAATVMSDCSSLLWQRGVIDEAVTLLPCRIAYPLLQQATTVVARKNAATAIQMIGITLDSDDSLLATISAALMDLMFSFEHMASIVVELCDRDALAVDLLREICRFDGSEPLGMKNIAPFLSELSKQRPALVMQHLTQLQALLNLTEPYQIRSAVVTTMAHCTVHSESSRSILLDAMAARAYDVSSYTRAALMKAWVVIVQARALPKDRWVPSARLAVDRLQDKTAMVRRQALILLMELLQNHPFPSLDPQPYRDKLATLYKSVMDNLPEDIADLDAPEQAALAAVMERVSEAPEASDEYTQKVQALQFTQAALEFIEVFEDAKDNLYGLLLSSSATDVVETLKFVVQAYHMQLPVTNLLQRSLALLWSTETRTPALQTFVDVFVNGPGGDLLPSETIAQNLIHLANQSSDSELASMEEAIIRLVTEERLPDEVFLILWSMVSHDTCRATALHLLSMGAGADRSIIDSKSRLKLLLEAGFADPSNCKVLRATCLCLQRIERAHPDPSDAKYLILESVMEELCNVCRSDQAETSEWFSVSEHAVKALFVICPEPEASCKRVLVGMSNNTFGQKQVHPLKLARFFHLLGNIVLNLLVYVEALNNSVRRGNAKRSLKNQEEKDNMEDELGVAAAEEAETESRMADIAEHEIVGRNLVSMFTPLLVRVVGSSESSQNETLMQAATLALCKCMCVSNGFCEKYLPLVFQSLAPDQDTTMRANTVVALGDLAFRFPNAVEPYTPRLYACLRDASTKVRRHTLMVLTHLILNDMIKVKGQVSEIAMCLRDDDCRIRDMARLLFFELSKRSNSPIYNWLPEIISQIIEQDVAKEDFKAIMAFLFGFIKKDRQNDMLTEKLCQRFSKCSTSKQAADMVFCLSLLKTSEKSLKCLSDNFNLYKDFLFDDEIKKSFSALIAKARKFMKPELRQVLEEWEAKLSELVAASEENHEANTSARRAKKKARSRRQQKLTLTSVQEDDEDDVLQFTEKENAPGIEV